MRSRTDGGEISDTYIGQRIEAPPTASLDSLPDVRVGNLPAVSARPHGSAPLTLDYFGNSHLYTVNYLLRNIGMSNWRWMFISDAVPAFIFPATAEGA